MSAHSVASGPGNKANSPGGAGRTRVAETRGRVLTLRPDAQIEVI